MFFQIYSSWKSYKKKFKESIIFYALKNLFFKSFLSISHLMYVLHVKRKFKVHPVLIVLILAISEIYFKIEYSYTARLCKKYFALQIG